MSKNLIPLIIVAAVIIIGALGVYLVMNQSSTNTDTNTNVNSLQKAAGNTNPASPTQTGSPTPVPTIVSSQTLPDGLKIDDYAIGDGAEVKTGDTIVMHYTGTFENGQKFDSSVDRNQPFETKIGAGQVIKGWDEGVIGMKVGGKRRLTVPGSLAYGEQGIPAQDQQGKAIPGQYAIPPNATLIFELELLQIK
ncbi:MAG: FKBP-type peptidyl-prolyl cis-trans isomerase [Candidatus Levybacteria bacterium]|nr:FKBP-type peptidyl-prolyl cis-trans isomerase [Candidatus Levybacteria bacterium]